MADLKKINRSDYSQIASILAAYDKAQSGEEKRTACASILQAMEARLGRKLALRLADVTFRSVKDEVPDGLYRGEVAWAEAAREVLRRVNYHPEPERNPQ
jgi:hypothetical protein